MRVSFCTVDVFTERRFGGNPLAVCNDAPELPASVMQQIAREFNLSETVFIMRSQNPRAARSLRIFTPARELPFAGHPTIGAAHVLVEAGLGGGATSGEFVLEEKVGLVPIRFQRRDGGSTFLQLTTARVPEEVGAAPPNALLAQLLGLDESQILGDRTDFAQVLSCGVPFLFIPVKDRRAIASIKVNAAVSERLQVSAGNSQAFVFCFDPELPGSQVHARMFAPEFGISEDPATGSAAAAFAGYLVRRAGAQAAGTLRWTIEQGFEMGRPSLLFLEADVADSVIRAVRLGGTAVNVSEGVLSL